LVNPGVSFNVCRVGVISMNFTAMGVDGDRSGIQVDAESPGWRAQSGHGPSDAPSDRPAACTGMCTAISERW
jgi:hypothetical protein